MKKEKEETHLYYLEGMLVALNEEQVKKAKSMNWHIERALPDEMIN